MTVLDRQFIIDNEELVQRNCAARGVSISIRYFVMTCLLVKETRQQLEGIQAERKVLTKMIPRCPTQQERVECIALSTDMKQRIRSLQEAMAPMEQMALNMQMQIPNMTHPEAPGADAIYKPKICPTENQK
jgi:seryl-tRNA synthetase